MKHCLNFKASLKTCGFCLLCLTSLFTAEAQNATIDSSLQPKNQQPITQLETVSTEENSGSGSLHSETNPPVTSAQQSPMEFSKENLLKNLQNIDKWVIWSVGGVLLLLILIVALSRKSPERNNEKNADVKRTQEDSQFAHSRQFKEHENNHEELPTLRVAPPSGRTPEARSGKQVLAILEEPATGRSWNITETRTDIGRGSKNDICLNDNSVSSVHCALKLDQDGVWTLIDLNSTNHIYANGQILTSLELRHNTEFELGKIRLKFKIC